MPQAASEREVPLQPTVTEIAAVIAQYAAAYAAFEDLQRRAKAAPASERLLPIGDQKTGAVGEFYARVFLADRHPQATVSFAHHGERGWDLEVREPNTGQRPRLVQVKCVSVHSRTRRLSPIHAGWDELFVIALDHAFAPAGFWVIETPNVVPSGGVLAHCCAPHAARDSGKGSGILRFGANRVVELLSALARAGIP